MSIEAAAEFLGGLSESTIRNWLSQGKLTRVKIGSRTMIREAELLNLIRPVKSTTRQGAAE
jgi:excisionase family DNA binding protein